MRSIPQLVTRRGTASSFGWMRRGDLEDLETRSGKHVWEDCEGGIHRILATAEPIVFETKHKGTIKRRFAKNT